MIYLSDRNLPLVYMGAAPSTPRLTIENYCKWYVIAAVMPDGTVTYPPLANQDCEKVAGPLGIIAWHDHVPNPEFCLAVASTLDYEWHEQSLEMIIGRYMREVHGQFCGAIEAPPDPLADPRSFQGIDITGGVPSEEHVRKLRE